MTFRPAGLAALIAASFLLAACGSMTGSKNAAVADLRPTGAVSPNNAMGQVTLTPMRHGLRVAGEVRGLRPGSEHGMHIHEKGDCGDNGNASGGHFNPAGGTHGKFASPASHAGDLPSLVADASGTARFSVDVHSISMEQGQANNVLGRAIVVHRDPDDFTSQPAGNSGPRIACGLITRR